VAPHEVAPSLLELTGAKDLTPDRIELDGRFRESGEMPF
jgi:hypothetical protein